MYLNVGVISLSITCFHFLIYVYGYFSYKYVHDPHAYNTHKEQKKAPDPPGMELQRL